MKKLVLSVAVIATMGLASCGGGGLCECVNMDEMTDECKTMKDEWKAKFEKASEEEQKTMKAEIEACEKEKVEEAAPEEEAAH